LIGAQVVHVLAGADLDFLSADIAVLAHVVLLELANEECGCATRRQPGKHSRI
jgi:hypothetical protein